MQFSNPLFELLIANLGGHVVFGISLINLEGRSKGHQNYISTNLSNKQRMREKIVEERQKSLYTKTFFMLRSREAGLGLFRKGYVTLYSCSYMHINSNFLNAHRDECTSAVQPELVI